MLSLKDKAFVEGFYDLFWLSIVLVIPAVFLGQVCVDRVVEIVAPDGVQSESALASRQNQTTIVLVRFCNQSNPPIGASRELLHIS